MRLSPDDLAEIDRVVDTAMDRDIELHPTMLRRLAMRIRELESPLTFVAMQKANKQLRTERDELKTRITDVADDLLGIQEVAPSTELLDRIESHELQLRLERNQLRSRVEELETTLDNIGTHAMSSLRDGGCDADDVAGLESACEYICELAKGVQP